MEKQELDDLGLPRIAYRSPEKRDKAQYLLFEQDREQAILDDIKEEIENMDVSSLTPLEALNFLNELKKKIKK